MWITLTVRRADSLTEESQDHRTVSSLLHSKASPVAFVAPLWWWWLSVIAATFCSSRHTCSRYFLRICRYELKALLEWKKPTEIQFTTLTLTKTLQNYYFSALVSAGRQMMMNKDKNMQFIKYLSCDTYLWACVSRAICSPLSLLWEVLSDRAVFRESWTKASLFFRACSLKTKVRSDE